MTAERSKFRYIRVPVFIVGIRPVDVSIYTALRSFARFGLDSADEFCRCWPSLKTLAARAGLNVKTARASLKRLEKAGVLYIRKRWNQSSVITFVDQPERFRATRDAKSQHSAEREVERALEGATEELRRERARGTTSLPPKNYGQGGVPPRGHLRTRAANPQASGNGSPSDGPRGYQRTAPPPTTALPPKNDLGSTSNEIHGAGAPPLSRTCEQVQSFTKGVKGLRQMLHAGPKPMDGETKGPSRAELQAQKVKVLGGATKGQVG